MKAAESRRTYDWDHTAEMMALIATIHTSGNYQRDQFHPFRESTVPLYDLDDPGAEYERLMKGKQR